MIITNKQIECLFGVRNTLTKSEFKITFLYKSHLKKYIPTPMARRPKKKLRYKLIFIEVICAH